MRNGKATSIYMSGKLAALIKKRGAGMAAGATATMERYFALLEPSIARMQRDFGKEIPILAAAAPLEKWRKEGLRGAVAQFVEDHAPEELDREELLERLSELSVLESYALGEAIERAATQAHL